MHRLHAQGVPVVAVFLSGRPMWVNRELNASDAFVAAWLPGSEGAGIADVLFRAPDGSIPHDFTGRLGFSWPQTAMPVTFDEADHARGALFARGYGLDYQHSRVVARLSENPRIPRHFSAADSLFFDAHVTAPWKIFVADEIGEVGLTTARQESPQGALVTSAQPVGNVTTWAGTHPGELRISGRAADLGSLAAGGAALAYRYRVDLPPTQPVRLGLRCAGPYLRHPSKAPAGKPSLCGTAAGAALDVTKSFRTSPVGTWITASVPLACFTSGGADLSNVEAPFVIGTAGQLGLTIAEVRIVPHAAAASCAGR
jgi:beta-glucosidase